MILIFGLTLITIVMLYKGGVAYQYKEYQEAIDWFKFSIGISILTFIECTLYYIYGGNSF